MVGKGNRIKIKNVKEVIIQNNFNSFPFGKNTFKNKLQRVLLS